MSNTHNWIKTPLEDIVSVIDPHPSHRAPDAVEHGIPFFGIGDLKEDGTYSLDKVRIVPEKIYYEHIKRYSINSQTIGFGRVATIGKVINFREPDAKFTVSPTLAVLQPNGIANRNFIFYSLKSEFVSEQIDKLLTGSTRSSLGIALLRKLNVLLPPEAQQQKIANILNTVDNLIDQTQNLIDKYTAVKQGMMADLFSRGIDLSGTPETNKSYGQLRPRYEEAPELYQETELGWIPVSWEVVTLESISTVERGKFTHRPRDDERCYGGVHPFIQTGSVTKSQGGFITEYKQTLSDFGRNVSKEFPAGTIAVTIAANIADTGVLEIPMCFPDSVVGVVVNNDFAITRFVEIAIRRSKRKLDALAPLSAQKNINLEDLRPLKLALPNIEEQKELCRRYETQELLIQQEKAYLEKLNLKKKGLMQDLLTGKVKV